MTLGETAIVMPDLQECEISMSQQEMVIRAEQQAIPRVVYLLDDSFPWTASMSSATSNVLANVLEISHRGVK